MASSSQCNTLNKAVFLDRDGVINPLVYNPLTGEYESPHYIEDFSIYPEVVSALKKLNALGYQLFLVSNQPSYAKGKTSLENIKSIHSIMEKFFLEQGIEFKQYYYCYHHPNGIIPEYSTLCDCRKPNNRFLKEAQDNFGVDFNSSWFVGDQDSDMECGKSVGLKTILLINKNSAKKRGNSNPDYTSVNLTDAVKIIEKIN